MSQGRRLRCAIAGIVCAATVAACTRKASSPGTVSLDGTPVSLASLEGQVTLVNIWSVWCFPCRVEIPVLERLQRRYAAAVLRIVGVNIDARGDGPTVERFARAASISYPVWLDADGSVSARFAREGVPASYLIGRGGELLWARQGVIPEGDPALAAALHRALSAGAVPA